MKDLVLGFKLLLRSLRAGELTLLCAALALAVASMATVGLFTDRMRLALDREANRLLGADLVIAADRPIPPEFGSQARTQGLATVATVGFRSMVSKPDASLLTEITAVDPGYPLRGTSRIASGRGQPDRVPDAIPAPGTIWADERLISRLEVSVGDTVEIGERRLTIAALLTQDPGMAIAFLGLGPRVIMNRADVESTGLIQPGSRVGYRLLAAGEPSALAAYRAWAATRIGPGQRLDGVRDSRPEIRSALERAERFMGLAALTTAALAAVAVLLAARRFHERHLDACAMLRCLGASQWRVFRLQLVQLACAGLAASVIGCAVGYGAQAVLGQWLTRLVGVTLPAPGIAPALQATVLGLTLLFAFALPPLLGLRQVPALRVLRRDVGGPKGAGIAGYALGVAAIAVLVFWQARELKLGAYVLGACVAVVVASVIFTRLGLMLMAGLRFGTGVTWRYGLASLRRRASSTTWQVMALALGLMALLTLTLIRSDLLAAWNASLPADAPNRFLVNIQPDQVADLEAFFAENGLARPVLSPMVRGRLAAVNGKPVTVAAYSDDRARRLVDREFNLSWAERMSADNLLVRGEWWRPAQRGEALLSVEEGIARTLGWKLGDRLTYDVAGQTFEARITSLRRVDWDSFRVNFFVLTPPGLIESYPATWITSVHLPEGRGDVVNALVKRFPSVVVIDVASILAQVQTMIGQVARAVQFVFLFTLAAGLLVLYAGIAATHDERIVEAAIMRTLGARRGQVSRAHAAEFFAIGALAGLLAAAGASGLGYFIGAHLLNLDFGLSPSVWLWGMLAGGLGVTATGLVLTRRVLSTPPLASLRQVM